MRADRAGTGYSGSTRRRIWPGSSLEMILLAGRGGAGNGTTLPMLSCTPSGEQFKPHAANGSAGGAASAAVETCRGIAGGCRSTESVMTTGALEWLGLADEWILSGCLTLNIGAGARGLKVCGKTAG